VAESVRINLGCGGKLLPGFVNVDLANNWSSVQPDLVCDVTGQLPFPTNHADEVHAYHVLEHIQRWKVAECLTEWVRVLKPGGLLVLEMPCFDKIARHLAHALIDGTGFDRRMTLWGLFGDPKYQNEAMMHKWCWALQELADMLFSLGLEDVQQSKPQTHQPNRDMRMTARKPSLLITQA
jgi:SAM-dependent methyltransferase